MGEPVIIEAARTPIGKRGGHLSGVIAPKLLASVQQEVLKRSGIEPEEVDQIVGGCVTQAGQQASNVTRNAWLSTGKDYSPAATTIDCQCGSGAQANTFVQGLIATGGAQIALQPRLCLVQALQCAATAGAISDRDAQDGAGGSS